MITEIELIKLKEAYRFPFEYNDGSQQIFDADARLVLDIRGWGWLLKFGETEAITIQDNLGKLIVNFLNQTFE